MRNGGRGYRFCRSASCSLALASKITFSSAVPLMCALTPNVEAFALALGRDCFRRAFTFSARFLGACAPVDATFLDTRFLATSSLRSASPSPWNWLSASALRCQHCFTSVLHPCRYAGPVYT